MSTERLLTHVVRYGIAGTVAGGIGSIWGYLIDPREFFSAWLAGLYFWLSMPLGALALLLIHDLTGGRWESAARVPLEAMAGTMPVFVPLFLPMIAALTQIYPWARPQEAANLHNTWYLNLTFFYSRAAAYFVIWNALVSWRVLVPALTGIPRRPAQWLSGIGLMLLLYSVAYSGIDWILSTEPDWFSSIFGMIACSTRIIVAIAAALLLLLQLTPVRDRRTTAFKDALPGLVRILIAGLIFWIYAEFCQWLIIWEENLHKEIGWYLERWSQPWAEVIYVLLGAHFLVPFLALVWGPTKRNPAVVGPICVLLLLADVLYIWWLLLPGLRGIQFSWIHPAVLIAMGGIWLLTLGAILRSTRGGESSSEAAQGGLIRG